MEREVGELLCRARRLRAFGGAAAATAFAEEKLTAAGVHGEKVAPAPSDDRPADAATSGAAGLSQAALDELTAATGAIGEGIHDSRPAVVAVIGGPKGGAAAAGLSQAALDALTGVPAEAAAPADSGRHKEEGPTGLSQAELDALTGTAVEASGGPAAEATEPAELCFLLRRTRAFLGAGAAEALAARLAAKGHPQEAVGGRDPLEQVATPSRRRRFSNRSGGGGLSPCMTTGSSPKCGGA